MASRESGNLSGGGGVAATAAALAAAGTSPHQTQQQHNPAQAPMTAAGAGGSVGSLPAGGSQATVAAAAAGGGTAEGAGRVSNVQRIQQKKAQVRAWPRDKKLEKLAIYSACKVSVTDDCLGTHVSAMKDI